MQVPCIVHEASMARLERVIRRLWVLCIILVVLFVGTNVAWIVYESQFETVVVDNQEVEQWADDNSNNQFIGGDYYGSEAKGYDDNR